MMIKLPSYTVFARSALASICLASLITGCSSETATPIPGESPQVTVIPTPYAMVSATPAGQPNSAILPEPSPTASPSPLQTAQVQPTVSSRKGVDASSAAEESLYDALLAPFVNEANRRRIERAKSDPDFAKRIDQELNAGRVNFLLYGYGETHEPPNTEKAIIGSQTLISYDTKTRSVDIVSLTHDIRAPEIERELAKRGFTKSGVVRIDQAYSVGGFKLMQRVLENATGLAVDFQVTFRETVMQEFIDSVLEGIVVDVPAAFDVHPFYLDGVKYEKGSFAKGKQKLSGRQVIQFIKTVPITEGYYGKALEHNVRKHLIFSALLQALEKNHKDTWFWAKAAAFVTGQLATGTITYDFDPVSLIVNNVGSTIQNAGRLINKETSNQMPRIQKSIYIVDPAHGEGGVQWVSANAAVNPITKRDIENGVYNALDIEIPINANPYGDLVTEYWPSVRQVVKESFTNIAASAPARTVEDTSSTVLVPNQPIPIIFPKSGDIIAKTPEQGHSTRHVIIGADGKRTPIKESVYLAYSDQSLSPDGTIRLTISNNAVLSNSTSNSRSPGTILKSDGKKILLPPAVIGRRGLFGVVVRDGREILLFGVRDSRTQGVLYVLPEGMGRIEYIAWGSQTHENDLILTVRGVDQRARVQQLSPAIAYPLPLDAARQCGIDTTTFNSCAFGYYQRMQKNLTLISDQGEYAASVAR